MEKIIMERKWLKNIPVLMWKGVPLIRIEKTEFVTATPIGKGIRTMEIAERMANQFSEKYDCQATVTNDVEWKMAINYLKVNFAMRNFMKMNELDVSEALLKDSRKEQSSHILAGGELHGIDELFHGFISDFDAKGEKQPSKLVFFTIRFKSDLIE